MPKLLKKNPNQWRYFTWINYKIPFKIMRAVKLRCAVEGIPQSEGVEKALKEWGEAAKIGEIMTAILDNGKIPPEILAANEQAEEDKIKKI